MKITFVGATEFSKHCLNIIREYTGDVQVLTREGGHGDWVEIEGTVIEDINDEKEQIEEFAPDYIFVMGWSQIIGKPIRDIAPVLGTHPTLLPRGRGRHALGHILNGKYDVAGLTFFWIDGGVDTGDIFMQKTIDVGERDDLRSLYEKLKRKATKMLPAILNMLEAGFELRELQEGRATYWDKLPEEEQVDYSRYFGTPRR